MMKNMNRILLFSFSLLFVVLHAEEEVTKNEEIAKKDQVPEALSAICAKDGYTINYNTVSIVEYIRFVSKICNVNFIFNEAELPFTVTVVSDAPVTPDNVMATLIQTLRIHGMMILEQGNNLVIHRSETVRQPATLVFGDEKNPSKTPIVTRVFRLRNANVDSVAAIIRPMISDGALVEVSHETRQVILTDATMVVDKIAALIENLDSPHTSLEIRNFETKYNTPEYLITLANQIMTPIAQGNPFILVPQSLANAIFIVSTPELNEKAATVLTNLDTPPKKTVLAERKIKSENIFVVKLEHRPGDEILKSLREMADKLQQSGVLENDLIETIESAKWIRETNSLMFVGSPEANIKIKELVTSLDQGIALDGGQPSFFVYRAQNRPLDEVQRSMQEIADNLSKTKGANETLIAAIRSQKPNPLTNTLLYSGDADTFSKIKELLLTVDTPSAKGAKAAGRANFFVYKIQMGDPDRIQASLKSFAKNLSASGLPEDGLIDSVNNVKYIPETHSLIFVGPDDALKRLQEILPQFDAEQIPMSSQFLAYKPKFVKGEILVKQLKETKDQLKSTLADPALLRSLESMKWVKNTNTLLFTGDAASLKKIEDLIATIDNASVGVKEPKKTSYYIYKLQYPNGEAVEEDLDNLVKTMKTSGMKDAPLAYVLDNIRYVKETNSLLLTGEPEAIEEAKELIAKHDIPRGAGEKSSFFVYKPQHTNPAKLEKAIQDTINSLKNAELSDPDLLSALSSMKYVDATHSFVFTGNPETIAKVQGLLKEIDAPGTQGPFQLGKTTFYFYKLKSATGSQITASLKNIVSDLKKSGTSDTDFLSALESVKFVRETNSLMFTGTEDALAKVQTVVSQFDVPGPGTPPKVEQKLGPTDFFVYKPQSLSGPDLEATLHDFAENLMASGLNDPALFNTLNTMKYNEKTQSLVFTGDPKTLERVRQLLNQFDIPANLPPGGPGEPTIQAIDNTSFLVYKLEFHKGDEIQNALRQIAKDLLITNAPVNQGLLNSINSIQWLEITNSLLSSGDQETLTRLRELIKNLDVPLKQVFIEVLVLETSLNNAVTFGLEWGGKVNYKDRVAASFNNFAPGSRGASPPQSPNLPWEAELNAVNAKGHFPDPAQIAFQPNFQTGVIGDIIKHNGISFTSLGSLLNALEQDTETTIVMTPKIIAQDSRPATIFSGQNVPFAGSFITNNQGGGTLQTGNFEYRDVGMSLSITPVLGNSDIITMDISLDMSSQVSNSTGAQIIIGANASATGITTDRTTMQTTVHVPNNNFLVLSGFVRNQNTKVKSGIPCLGGLPLIGAAFTQNNDNNNNSNIVIFMRPTIINSLEDMKKLSSRQEEFFREQAGTPGLEHNFNEGMELIKSPEDE